MIYITSDLHLNHNKDFIWKARGFNSVIEMNQSIINNFNQIIGPEDTVYILGDCIMGDLDEGINLLKQLNGKKFLAYGNHDTDRRLARYQEENIFQDIQFGYRIKFKKRDYVLTHYPTETSNGSHESVYNLYGHTHQTTPFNEKFICGFNIGVDANNCYPWLLDDVHEKIKEYQKGV